MASCCPIEDFPTHVARELAAELAEMAHWLGMGEIAVGGKGDLATRLRRRSEPGTTERPQDVGTR
jgi:uncharacterized protein YcaQ